ncbi:hypothetical protein [Kitasatospora sp. NPDC001175]|uniref:hypothetical protein n=1 Tax=Kitasatospora sp. NPDC001175 TaxID=3157103 RepID=UPI003D0370A5
MTHDITAVFGQQLPAALAETFGRGQDWPESVQWAISWAQPLVYSLTDASQDAVLDAVLDAAVDGHRKLHTPGRPLSSRREGTVSQSPVGGSRLTA